MNTFTKGPWKVSKSFDNDKDIVVRDSKGEIVANCSVERPVDFRDFHKIVDETISNANLIAAAPELLEVLKDFQKQIHAHHRMNVKKDYSLMVADVAASKAVDRAEGRNR